MYDAAMIAAPFGVSVYFNSEKIEVNNLKDYAALYGPIDESIEIKTKDSIVYMISLLLLGLKR